MPMGISPGQVIRPDLPVGMNFLYPFYMFQFRKRKSVYLTTTQPHNPMAPSPDWKI